MIWLFDISNIYSVL